MSLNTPTWYPVPRNITIPVDQSRVKWSPLGNEVVISLTIGGSERKATVPVGALNQRSWTVYAAEVGEMNGDVLVSFPASSEGTSTWSVPKAHLSGITGTPQ